MKNYLNFETDIKNLETELEKLKDPYNEEGLAEVNTEKISKACSGIPGIDVCSVNDLSVLNLAPGGSLIRLTIFSKNALKEISQIKSNHLELMVTLK